MCLLLCARRVIRSTGISCQRFLRLAVDAASMIRDRFLPVVSHIVELGGFFLIAVGLALGALMFR